MKSDHMTKNKLIRSMDLVKTKYKQKYINRTTEYINTNIHKTTANTTKYMG